MEKWADYIITEASYDEKRMLSSIRRRKDMGSGFGRPEIISRLDLASDLKNKITHITAYDSGQTWKRGHQVRTYKSGGNYYIRIDANRADMDNLGDISEIS